MWQFVTPCLLSINFSSIDRNSENATQFTTTECVYVAINLISHFDKFNTRVDTNQTLINSCHRMAAESLDFVSATRNICHILSANTMVSLYELLFSVSHLLAILRMRCRKSCRLEQPHPTFALIIVLDQNQRQPIQPAINIPCCHLLQEPFLSFRSFPDLNQPCTRCQAPK